MELGVVDGVRKLVSITVPAEFTLDVVVATLLVLPNAVARTNAELFDVAAGIVVVAFDQRAPGFLLWLFAGIFQFAPPIGEPITDL